MMGVMAAEAKLLRRPGKIHSTELFNFQCSVKKSLSLFTLQRTSFCRFGGIGQKNIFIFFLNGGLQVLC